MSTIEAKPTPPLSIPDSTSTVSVYVIDSTSRIYMPTAVLLEPPVEDFDAATVVAYSFLVTNKSSDGTTRHVVFDLGVRTDLENLPPALKNILKASGANVTAEKDVATILDEASSAGESSPSSKDIEAVIWSHHHFDHTGNPATFPPSTALIVGSGFKEAILPGYPADPESRVLSSDWEGRELREIVFDTGLVIGGFKAFDYFGDGSFYLLDTPGHAEGHVCGLARVTTGPDSFIFMGGDAAHHAAEFRPTEYMPLPDNLALPSSTAYRTNQCPGEFLVQAIEQHRKKAGHRAQGSRTEPFFQPTESISAHRPTALETIHKMTAFDASDEVFVIIAHDNDLKDTLKWFPEEINGWAKERLDETSRWNFVDAFAPTVDSAASAAKA